MIIIDRTSEQSASPEAANKEPVTGAGNGDLSAREGQKDCRMITFHWNRY